MGEEFLWLARRTAVEAIDARDTSLAEAVRRRPEVELQAAHDVVAMLAVRAWRPPHLVAARPIAGLIAAAIAPRPSAFDAFLDNAVPASPSSLRAKRRSRAFWRTRTIGRQSADIARSGRPGRRSRVGLLAALSRHGSNDVTECTWWLCTSSPTSASSRAQRCAGSRPGACGSSWSSR